MRPKPCNMHQKDEQQVRLCEAGPSNSSWLRKASRRLGGSGVGTRATFCTRFCIVAKLLEISNWLDKQNMNAMYFQIKHDGRWMEASLLRVLWPPHQPGRQLEIAASESSGRTPSHTSSPIGLT
jgi:hypothetical protein